MILQAELRKCKQCQTLFQPKPSQIKYRIYTCRSCLQKRQNVSRANIDARLKRNEDQAARYLAKSFVSKPPVQANILPVHDDFLRRFNQYVGLKALCEAERLVRHAYDVGLISPRQRALLWDILDEADHATTQHA